MKLIEPDEFWNYPGPSNRRFALWADDQHNWPPDYPSDAPGIVCPCGTVHPLAPATPKLTQIERKHSLIPVLCPYCGGRHVHGDETVGRENNPEVGGFRWADCRWGGWYFLDRRDLSDRLKYMGWWCTCPSGSTGHGRKCLLRGVVDGLAGVATTTLYRFYDRDGLLLYIGIAGNPARRFKQHNDDKLWWSTVATSTMEHYPTRAAALKAEKLAIEAEVPLHNWVHNAAQRGRLVG